MKKYDNSHKRYYDIEKSDIRPRRLGNYSKKQRILLTICLLAVAFFLGITSRYFQKQQSDSEIVEAEVVRVVDGDTIIALVNGQEERIRMIGIDAPESVNSNEEENTVYGEMASQYTKEHLPQGMKIYLTFDEEREDKYERMLAYVWLSNEVTNSNNLYQKQMVADGYALAYVYEPNIMYRESFYLAMQNAISKKAGLWADELFYNENYNFIVE